MVEIKQVSLWRAEGRIEECYPIIFVNEGNDFEYHGRWEKANAPSLIGCVSAEIEQDVLEQMVEWGKTAPKGAYDKTDFMVYFTNGFTYAGRFDMSYGGLDGGDHFFKSLRGRMEYYCGLDWNNLGDWGPTREEHEENSKAMKSTLGGWN